MRQRWLVRGGLCLVLFGCGSIAPDKTSQDAMDAAFGAGDASTDCTTIPPAVDLSVDASSQTEWVYFNLARARVVAPADPATSKEWDVAFKRFSIKLNGGASGSGGAEAVVLQQAFEAVSEIPASGFLSDAPDGSDDDVEADYLLSTGETGWYEYDATTHVLTPRPHVYVVHEADGNVFKLAVTNYYNSAGSSGYPSIKLQPLAALCAEDLSPLSDAGSQPQPMLDSSIPDGLDAGVACGTIPPARDLTVDASNAAAWTYLHLLTGRVVTPSHPDNSEEWDLAFQRFSIKLNGGASGSGGVEALALMQGFDSVTDIPLSGFASDAADGPDEGTDPDYLLSTGATIWYGYNEENHRLTPLPLVYVVRAADGNIFKVAVTSYYNAQNVSGYPTLRFQALKPLLCGGEPAVDGGLEDAGEEDAGDAEVLEDAGSDAAEAG